MSCQDTTKIIGQHLLFLGVGTISWTTQQFQQAAQFAKAHDIQSLLVKVADGTNKWYNGLSGYQSIKAVIQSEGVGCIPYIYSYGDKYQCLDSEIDILISYMQDSGVVVADMETEWNGQIGWAQHLCSRMQGQSGVFLVSTWADPSLQNWQGVLQALNPCVSAYMPQQYSTSLGSYWQEFGASCLQPTLNMTQDFGANDPVALAKAAHDQGHTAISIWYYETATQNPQLLDQILAAFPKTIGENTMTIPQGWSDDGTTLKAPDGTSVTLGFRQHILNSTWDPVNIPLQSEQHMDTLEQSNTSLGAGQSQIFRMTRLEYNEKMGVFVGWMGQELLWYQKQYAALQAENAQLKTQIAQLTQPAQVLQQINSTIAQASTSLAEAGTALAQAAKLSQVQ